jgi:hypothetical protein
VQYSLLLQQDPTTANPLLLALFGAAFSAVLLGLIITLEATGLQSFNWGSLRACIRTAAQINLASILPSGLALALVPALGWLGILLSYALAVLIEGWLLARRLPGMPARTWTLAVMINLVSYAILIAPTYLISLNLK